MAEALTLVTPSSVSGTGSATASITGNGKVVATGVNSSDFVSVDGIFSSTHFNYLLIFSSVLGSGTLRFCLRTGGSDATSGYDHEVFNVESTTAAGSESLSEASARILACTSSVYPSAGHVYVFGPNIAAQTPIRSVTIYQDTDLPRFIDYAVIHTTSTAYTGITLKTGDASPSTNFHLQVFGFNK